MLKKVTALIGLTLFISACDPLDEYRAKSDVHLYETAIDLMQYGRYERAAKVFEEVDLQHPSSSFAPKSLIMAGYCYYSESNPDSKNTNKFPDAIDKFESFLRLHPNHEMKPYAMYMIGMCYFEMLGDEMRDQGSGINALNAFNSLVQKFPKSPYSIDVAKKTEIIKLYDARKNIYIASTLIADRRYAPAVSRLQKALKEKLPKQDLSQALTLINQAYSELGLNHLIVSLAETKK